MQKHPTNFYNWLKSGFFLTAAFLFLNSCKRDKLPQIEETLISIEIAKNWYAQTFGSISGGINSEANPNLESAVQDNRNKVMQKLGKFIKWESFEAYKTNGRNYILVDIDDKNILFDKGFFGNRKLIFYYDNANIIQMNVIELLSKSNLGLNNNSYKKVIAQFFHSGNSFLNSDNSFFALYDMNYFKLESLDVIKGSLHKSRGGIGKRKHQSTLSNTLTTENECVLWGYYLVYRDGQGNIISEQLLYTFNVCGDGINNPNNQDNPGEYGGNSDEYFIFQEVDNLTDPCLKSAKQAIANNSLANYVYKLYTSAYLTSGNLNISWNQNPSLGANSPAVSQLIGNTWVLAFNNSYFANNGSSKQFVGSVMLHEIIHTLLLQNNILNTNNPSNWLDHTVMFYNWTNHMRDALIESFAMDVQSATALALGGINDVLSYSYDPNGTNTSFRNFMNTFSVTNYNITLSTAENIQLLHSTGVYGTPCN